MSRPIGFSTGSLAKGDYRAALAVLKDTSASAVELSALREAELEQLMKELSTLDISQFQQVSVHAPSAIKKHTEAGLVRALEPALRAGYPIVIHADILHDFSAWKEVQAHLCIENMDKRKTTGRTWREMGVLFQALPKAKFCLDLAHARQIDPTMCEAVSLLMEFGDKLTQIHLSELNSASKHEPLTYAGHLAVRSICQFIPPNVPVILEHEAKPIELNSYIDTVRTLLKSPIRLARDVG